MTAKPLPAPDNAHCPRCGQAFRCGVNDAMCHCMAHHLSATLRETLRRTYSACLCGPCLQALQAQELAALPEASNGKDSEDFAV